MWKNITIFGLVLLIFGLIYINRTQKNESVSNEIAVEAIKDTLHTFKSVYGSEAGYISTIVADRKNAIKLLEIEKDKNQELIKLLDSNKTVVNAAHVKTETKYVYISDIDTTFKGLKFTKTIQDDKWITETIKVDSNKLSRNLSYRDAYLFHMDKKDNKGWFTGSTLTTYVEPMNPKTKVTGITSVSTVIEKRKPRIGTFLGPALNIDREGNIKAGLSLGVGLTF